MLTSAALIRLPQSPPDRRLAIIMPTLDEAAALRQHLPKALALVDGPGDELIVSDGGSTDGTQQLAATLGARVVTGSRGRGSQLNRGAAVTEAGILLFLHADTQLPPDSARAIRQAIDQGAVGGGFQVEFDDRRPILRLGNRLVAARTRLFKTPLGDQAQFVRRDVFEQLNGYQEWPILEDLDFAQRLRASGPVEILPGPATTAARRFVQQGIARTVVTNWCIWILYFFGVSPHRLAGFYRNLR